MAVVSETTSNSTWVAPTGAALKVTFPAVAVFQQSVLNEAQGSVPEGAARIAQ
jgi:hypothetical protein